MLGMEPKVFCVLGKAQSQSSVTYQPCIDWLVLIQDVTKLLKLPFS